MGHSSTSPVLRSFTATAVAITQFKRVMVDSAGLISVAGATDVAVGVVIADVAASGVGTVMLNGAGTMQMVAAAAITRGATLYAAAAGKVDDTGTNEVGYVALETATAENDIIECAQLNGRANKPGPFAATDIGTLAGTGTVQGDAAAIVKLVTQVTGGDGTVGVKLPLAVAGLFHMVYNASASALKVYPNTSDTIAGGSANAAISMAAHGTAIFVAFDGTDWMYVEPDQA